MRKGTAKSYEVFVRDWWREPANEHERQMYGDGLVPYPGAPARRIARGCTAAEAKSVAREYNETHKPGRYSRKAEWTEE